MTAKERLYAKAVKMVGELVADGLSVTEARTRVSLKVGLSYPIIVKLTKQLNVKKSKED